MLTSHFASISPRTFGAASDGEDEKFFDMEWMGGLYADLELDGTLLSYGSELPSELVKLQAGLTLPEFATAADRPELELAGLTTVLKALDLPFYPKMPMADIRTACMILFPSLLITKPARIKGASPKASTSRLIAGLCGSLLVEFHFSNDEFWRLEVTDLGLVAANDEAGQVTGPSRRDMQVERMSAIRLNPVPAALESLGTLVHSDNIEWSRQFPLNTEPPAPSPEPKPEKSEATFLPAPALVGSESDTLEILGAVYRPRNRLEAAVVEATHAQDFLDLKAVHGSFANLLERTPDDVLISKSLRWLGQSPKSMHPQPPSLARMVQCLEDLNFSVVHGEGLESWLTCSLKDAWDTMPSLVKIQAHGIVHFIADFTAQAAAKGCRVIDQESWCEHFRKHPKAVDEKAFAGLAKQLPGQFRTWALSQRTVLEQLDVALSARFAEFESN